MALLKRGEEVVGGMLGYLALVGDGGCRLRVYCCVEGERVNGLPERGEGDDCWMGSCWLCCCWPSVPERGVEQLIHVGLRLFIPRLTVSG